VAIPVIRACRLVIVQVPNKSSEKSFPAIAMIRRRDSYTGNDQVTDETLDRSGVKQKIVGSHVPNSSHETRADAVRAPDLKKTRDSHGLSVNVEAIAFAKIAIEMLN